MALVKFWLDFATISGKLLWYAAWPWNIFGFFYCGFTIYAARPIERYDRLIVARTFTEKILPPIYVKKPFTNAINFIFR